MGLFEKDHIENMNDLEYQQGIQEAEQELAVLQKKLTEFTLSQPQFREKCGVLQPKKHKKSIGERVTKLSPEAAQKIRKLAEDSKTRPPKIYRSTVPHGTDPKLLPPQDSHQSQESQVAQGTKSAQMRAANAAFEENKL